eukprot:TRINITY_DN34783_c0_g2_i1.p1 TRINITY_DN34783_c0_g2~~TRINITY_DN34783_c0_g2_i1.p1  ORF type:complete len:661 (-),score=106.13 TRINITY_DN34783_c0_g2_i1:67-2049(-)
MKNSSMSIEGVGVAQAAADHDDAVASLNSVIFTTSLLVLIIIGYRINTHRLRHLPESGAAMALGFFVGLMVRVLGLDVEEERLQFSGEFFFHVLLPPIIFEAGLSLETKVFVDNLGAILAFAVGGTLISTWVVSSGLYKVAETGLFGLAVTPHLGIQCHLFGALISATDPVATIALFGSSRFRADPLLHSLVNGESVLNDAVAIVLFTTLSHHMGSEQTPSLVSIPILGHFFLVSLGSTIVGFVAGAVLSFCFCQSKYLRRFPDFEISTMCLGAYLTFALSQLLGLSGIVSLFFFGIVLAHYNYYNLSEASKVASKITFGTLAKMAEWCVFLYLGSVAAHAVARFHWHIALMIYTAFVIIVARAAHIFPLTMLLNVGRQRTKIDRNMTLMMWISGLRGAIAFALALRVPCDDGRFEPRGSEQCRNSDLFVTTTISVVVLTTLVVGTAMEHVATYLRVIEPLATCAEHRGRSMSDNALALSVPLAARDGSAEEGLYGGESGAQLVTEGSHAEGRMATSSKSAHHSSSSETPPPGYIAAPTEPFDGSQVTSSSRQNMTEHGGGLELRPVGSFSGGGGSSSRSSWQTRFDARGPLYQAFAQFDFDVLQPRLGGPCRRRTTSCADGSIGATSEMVLLESGWSRHGEPPPTDDEAPPMSRSFVFE